MAGQPVGIRIKKAARRELGKHHGENGRAQSTTERVQRALRDSEERFSATFEQAAVGIAHTTTDGRILEANQKLCDILGYTTPELLRLKTRELTLPEDRDTQDRLRQEVIAGERPYFQGEKRYVRKDGRTIWVNRTVTLARQAASAKPYLIQVFEDITERKRIEQRLDSAIRAHRVLAECGRALVHAEDETALLRKMCRIVVESGGYKMAWVGLATGDPARPVHPAAHAGFGDDAPMTGAAAWGADGRYQGFMHEVITTGGPHIARDILNDPKYARRRARAVQHGFQSSIALPLKSEGRTLGAIAIYAREPDAFDSEEIELLTELANDIAFGIAGLRTRSAREKAEERSRENERRFRETFEQAAVGISRVGLDGVLVDVNQKFCDMLGYARDELLGKAVKDITHPADYGRGSQYRAELAHGAAKSMSSEKRFLRKDGTIMWARRTMSSVCDDAGNPQYVISVVEDITARKELERRFELTFNQAAVGMTQSGLDGRLLQVNQKYADMLGYTREELLGKRIEELTHPEDRPETVQTMQKLRDREIERASGEKRLVRKDGRAIWVNRTSALVRDDSGEPLHYIAIIEDITERKELERRFELTFNHAAVGMTQVDLDGRFVQVNRKYAEMLGYSREELVGMSPMDVTHPDDRAEAPPLREKLLNGEVDSVSSEKRLIRKDGRVIWVTRTISLARGVSAEPLYFISIVENITERKELERRYQETFDQAAVGIVHTSADGRYLRVNRKFCEMLGYSEPELLGRAAADFTYPEDRDKGRQYRQLMWEGKLDQFIEDKRYVRKDGSMVWTNRTVSLARDASGTPLYFIRVIEDITDRKEAAERYRATFDSAPVGIMHTAVDDDRILHANAKLSELLGYTYDELVCMKTDDFIHPDYVGADQPKYREKMLKGEVDMFSSERLYRRKDGSDLWVNRTVSLARDSAGSPLYFIRIIEDITERTQSARRRATEHAVTQALAEAATVEEAMPVVLRTICQALGWTCGAHWKWNETEELLRCDATWHVDAEGIAEFVAATRESPNEAPAWRGGAPGTSTGGVVRRVWFSGAPAWFADVMQHPDFRRGPAAARAGLHSAFGFPILAGTQPLGVMEFYSRDIEQPDEALLQMVRAIGSQIGQFIQRKQAEDKVLHLAQFDTVTGLPNRYLFHDRMSQTLAQAQRNRWQVGVLFIDLDRFKAVNDTYGHAAGDRLLSQVAARIKECVRGGDTVGRLSGDEFAVVLVDLAKADDAGLVAQKIVTVLVAPFDLDGNQIYISASIGIALSPGDGSEPDALVRNADTAMYRAKEQGRNSYQFYLPQMNERLVERLKREARLRGALERAEFVLHYQPKVDLATGAISGLEALLRWKHEDRLVSPAEFVPILENMGLIVPVGDWVFRHVCEQIRLWEHEGVRVRPVAVNVSARQFQRQNLAEMVGRALKDTGVDPGLVELELTETLLMSDAEEAVQTLLQLKALDVRLALDDFGTGYSSLTYLKRFPLDLLKIDRAFVRDAISDPDDAAITLTIINLAHSLKLKVVAEGVETEAQLNFLCLHGCDEMQGFYFSRPLPVEDCSRLLAEGRRLQLPKSAAASDLPVLLLLDDNEEELRRLEQALDPECFRILTATSPKVAFDILALHGARIVISDHRMPEMTGVEFLTKVRKLYPDTVRVIASGDGDAPTLTRAINRAGIHKFLSKSWGKEQLRAEVREANQQQR